MDAGSLREKVAFDRRADVEDGAGNVKAEWRQVGSPVSAAFLYLKGSEPVIAQRLEGRQPIVITVRSSTATRSLATDMRVRDVRSGSTFNITSITPDAKRQWIDLLCIGGGVDG